MAETRKSILSNSHIHRTVAISVYMFSQVVEFFSSHGLTSFASVKMK
jgi:hypothetical protein